MGIQYFISRFSLIVRIVKNKFCTYKFSSPYSSTAEAAAIITIKAGRPKKFERLVAAGMSSYFENNINCHIKQYNLTIKSNQFNQTQLLENTLTHPIPQHNISK